MTADLLFVICGIIGVILIIFKAINEWPRIYNRVCFSCSYTDSCGILFQKEKMKTGILYYKDKKWFIETLSGTNTFTNKKSAELFAKFYNIKLDEKS